MAAIFPIRSASLKCPKQIGSAILPAEKIDHLTLPVVPRLELSLPGRTRLRVGLRKAGRVVVKCLSDAAMDSTMMWF
jgi:hypothetical protein